jgi:putative membrane protein
MTVPPPISAGRILTDWTFDPVVVVLVLAAALLYRAGVRRLARRDRRWPAARSWSFVAGLGVLTVATMSGLARYDTVLFSAHVVQHLALGMAAPILLALGAPVTLALQASHRHTQVFLIRLLHSPVVRTITHPVFAFVLFGGTLFVLYFTGLYELSLRNDLVHTFVHLHFVVAGTLFFWVVVGLDPSGWRLPHWARLLLVLAVVPFHAFLGVAILGSDQVLAADWYGGLGRSWGSSALADQHVGAGLLWGVGDLLAVGTAMIVLVQWMRHDERHAKRLDRRLVGVAPPLVLLLVLLAGCSSANGMPDPVTEQGQQTADLWNVFLAMAAAIGLLVYGLVAFVIIRYRRGKRRDQPSQQQYSGVIEAVYTVTPIIIVAAMFVMGWRTEARVTELSDDPDVVIDVIGFQWQWQFNYPDDDITVQGTPDGPPTMVVPVGRTVRLRLHANDVIHSFWVPEFRVKQDVVPGRFTEYRITPTLEGAYKVRCSELCGVSHSYMLAPVEVVSGDSFASWVEDKQAEALAAAATPEARGETIATQNGCFGCHTIDGGAGQGPTWQGLYGSQVNLADGSTVTADDAYIKESILKSQAKIVSGFENVQMPAFDFTDEQIADIIAYMKTLR